MNRLLNRPLTVGAELALPKNGTPKLSLLTVLLIGFFCLPSLAWSQLSPLGGEQQVNTSTAQSQEFPALAMDNNGNATVVWQSMATDGSGYGIFGRRFDNNGGPLSIEFQINTTTTSNQQAPAVASDASGNTVVVWMSQDQDGDGWGIYGQRYNAAGVAQGSEFLVNNTTAGQQREPQVAMDANGNFVVVWADNALDGSGMGIFARRFDASGTALGNAFQVNTFATGYQGHPQIALHTSGSFVIAWQSLGQDGSNHGVYFQRYDATGVAQGSDTQAATTTTDNQQSPTIGMAANGEFVLAWSSYGQDGSNLGVFGRRFSATGTASAGEFQVNTTTNSSQNQPHVMVASDGSFVISWTSYGQDGSYTGVYLQAYDPAGIVAGSESQVNTRTQDFQQAPRGAWTDSNNNLLLVWMDGLHQSNATHDGGDYGIYLRGYSPNAVPTTVTAVCQDATIYLDGSGTATLTTADIDGGSSSNAISWGLSLGQSNFSCTDLGTVSVNLIATTASGLVDNCTATVTVLDPLNPTLNCPANITVSNNPGICEAVVTYAPPVATDNCSASSPSLVSGLASGASFPIGNHTETWTVSDLSGNTATCSFDITVNDAEAPVINCPGPLVFYTWGGMCQSLVSFAVPTATDNCGTPSVVFAGGVSPGQFLAPGLYTSTWIATDAAGNQSTCSISVQVIDAQPPVIICPAPVTATAPFFYPGTWVSYNLPISYDNCGYVSLVQTAGYPSGSFFPTGTTWNTFVATDIYGNVSSCSFPVTVFASSGGWWWKTEQDDSPLADADQAEAPQSLPLAEWVSEEAEIQVFPNPFQDHAAIRFQLPMNANVNLDIYTMQGQKIKTLFKGEVLAGEEKEITFQPEGISSGIYYYRLTTDKDLVKTGKLIYQH